MKKIFYLFIFISEIVLADQRQKIVNLKYERYVIEKDASSAENKKPEASIRDSSTSMVNCYVTVNDIIDIRKNKVTIGGDSYESLFPVGLDQWLMSIKKYELEEKTRSWDGDAKILIKPALSRLYLYEEEPNIYGIFSLTVDISIDNQKAIVKKYRGVASKLNTTSRHSKYVRLLNDAVGKVIPNVVSDLESICATL